METDYLTFIEANRFIEQCDKHQTFIYGIERFVCENGSYLPDLDGIADFSSLSIDKVGESIIASQKFLSLFGNETAERFKLVCE